MTGTLLFVAASAAVAYVAARLAARCLPASGALPRLLAAVLLFVAVADVVLLALGALGWLRAGAVTLVSVALAALLLAVERRRPPRPAVDGGAARASLAEDAALALTLGLLACWLARTVGAGSDYVWDDLAYHATIPLWWVREGSLALVPLTYQTYYPAGAELFAAWFLLPFGTDALGNASVATWFALILLAGWTLAAELELARLPVALALACFALSPQVGFFAGTFSANDLAVAALGTVMLVFAWPGRDEREHGGRALLSGLAAGLALGTKVSIAPQVLCVAVWWASRRVGPAGGRRALATFLAATVAVGGAWYARNLWLTGNPLYPAELGFLDGPFSAAAQRKTSLVPTLVAGGAELSFWPGFLGRLLDWPLALGLAALAGYALAVVVALRWPAGPRRRYVLLLVVAGLLFAVLFPLQPFSGTNNRPTTGLNHLIRYLAWPFLLGLLLCTLAARTGQARTRTATAATAAGLLAALAAARPELPGAVWGLAGAAAGVVWSLLARRRPRVAAFAPAPLVVLGLCALGLAAPRLEPAAAENMYSFGLGRPMGTWWRALEELPDGARVAAITHDPASHGLYRPLLGRTRRLVPVAVDGTGRAEPLLHERPPDGRDPWWGGFEPVPRVTLAELRANLRAAGVDYLAVARWPYWPDDPRGVPWPPVRAVLRELGPAQRIHADGYGEIWDVRD